MLPEAEFHCSLLFYLRYFPSEDSESSAASSLLRGHGLLFKERRIGFKKLSLKRISVQLVLLGVKASSFYE